MTIFPNMPLLSAHRPRVRSVASSIMEKPLASICGAFGDEDAHPSSLVCLRKWKDQRLRFTTSRPSLWMLLVAWGSRQERRCQSLAPLHPLGPTGAITPLRLPKAPGDNLGPLGVRRALASGASLGLTIGGAARKSTDGSIHPPPAPFLGK